MAAFHFVRRLILCLLVGLALAPEVRAESAGARLSVSAISASRPISTDDLETSDGKKKFWVGGLLLVALRDESGPETVTLWSETGPGVIFFDVAPLVGLLSYRPGVEVLRKAVPPTTTDVRAALDAARAQSGGESIFLEAVLAASTKSETKTLTELTQTHERQRKLLDVAYDEERWITKLLEIQGAKLNAAKSWQLRFGEVFEHATRSAAPTVSKRLLLFPGAEPRIVAYAARVPSDAPAKVSASILLGLRAHDPLRVPVSFDVPAKQPGAVSQLWSFLVKAFENVVGLLIAAVVGYCAFLVQRKTEQRAETERSFETRKVEHSQQIRLFFTQKYKAFVEADNKTTRARLIREALVNEGIFAILPVEDALEVNQFATVQGPANSDAFEGLRALLLRRFGEFMDEH